MDLRFCSLLTLTGPHGLGLPEAGGGGHGLRAGTSTFTSCFHPSVLLLGCSGIFQRNSWRPSASPWGRLPAQGSEPFHPGNLPWEPSGAPSSSHWLGTGFCCRPGVRSGHSARPPLVPRQRGLRCPCRDRAEVVVPGGPWGLLSWGTWPLLTTPAPPHPQQLWDAGGGLEWGDPHACTGAEPALLL